MYAFSRMDTLGKNQLNSINQQVKTYNNAITEEIATTRNPTKIIPNFNVTIGNPTIESLRAILIQLRKNEFVVDDSNYWDQRDAVSTLKQAVDTFIRSIQNTWKGTPAEFLEIGKARVLEKSITSLLEPRTYYGAGGRRTRRQKQKQKQKQKKRKTKSKSRSRSKSRV